MIALEAHLGAGFVGLYGDGIVNVTMGVGYRCVCDGNDALLEIDCTLDYKIEPETEFYTSSEFMQFFSKHGVFELAAIQVIDSSFDAAWNLEAYSYEGGEISKCSAAVECSSCSVCEDKKSFAFDCSTWVDSEYTIECSELYSGAFSNTFDFGTIAVPANPSVSVEDFCTYLSTLETPLSEGYAAVLEKSDPPFVMSENMYSCACGEAGATLEIVCTLEYTLDGTSGTSVDKMAFEAKDGAYELVSTAYFLFLAIRPCSK
jgi:hypothetical protein